MKYFLEPLKRLLPKAQQQQRRRNATPSGVNQPASASLPSTQHLLRYALNYFGTTQKHIN